MITLYGGEFSGGLISCRIKTLLYCYHDTQNAPCLYKTGEGGVFCRFDDVILLSGECDSAELFEFADMLGINRIEAEDCSFDAPCGWESESYPILTAECVGGSETELAQLRCCFEIISSADANFEKQAQYLYWLSDMTRRINRGSAKAYSLEDNGCALVTAISSDAAYLSSVAVTPQKQGEKIGSSLLKAVLNDDFLRGKRLFTAAQSDDLIKFYKNNGFEPQNKRLKVFKRRKT